MINYPSSIPDARPSLYNRSLKVTIAVHGRFHAFDMARELIRRGHDVTLLTNYPRFAVKRFGVRPERVQSFVLHGVVSRIVNRLRARGLPLNLEGPLQEWFGRWVASQIQDERWDVVVCWSGVGEETFHALEGEPVLKVCRRGSSHIVTQARLLQEEEERTGIHQEQPSDWIIAREQREYGLADVIQVSSSFARESFLAEGVSPDRVEVILHGVETAAFRPSPKVIEKRCERILSGEPLHVLNVGTFSFRKGMWDLATVLHRLADGNFGFRFVGPVAPEAQDLVSKIRPFASFIPKRPQFELPDWYAWGDVFVLPTIEDGYPAVLGQAAAAGLPILTTPNGSGTDLVRHGESGWVLPVRDPDAFVDRLQWCDNHRSELADMVRRLFHAFRPRDWADMATDFERSWYRRLGH